MPSTASLRGPSARRPRGRAAARAGFTLLEMIIVMACIAILAAISIPMWLKSRLSSNEASAINSLRLICTCEAQSRMIDREYLDLNGLFTRKYLEDQRLSEGKKAGYDFAVTVDIPTAQWHAFGTPEQYNGTGTRSFYADESALLRAIDNQGVATDRTDALTWNALN